MVKEPIQFPAKDLDGLHRVVLQLKQAIERIQGTTGSPAPINAGQHGTLRGGNLHPPATAQYSGFMSSDDKSKLDGVEDGATADQTADEILDLVKTVDGIGSGLDTDTFQSLEPAYFAPQTALDAVQTEVDAIETTLGNLTGVLTGSAVLDFPSISPQSSEELTMTVTGAQSGDVVAIGEPASHAADISYEGYVSATDTVTIRAVNATGAAADPAPGTFRAVVFRF